MGECDIVWMSLSPLRGMGNQMQQKHLFLLEVHTLQFRVLRSLEGNHGKAHETLPALLLMLRFGKLS